MIVTSIEQQKKDKTKYNVFIDGEFAFGLIMQDILFFKIKEGTEISKDTFDYIKDTVLYIKAQGRALNYLGYKKRTEGEIRHKLTECQYENEIIDKVIEFLKKYNYVDDLDYAESYIRQTRNLKPKGTMEVRRKLRELGIDRNVVEEALAEEDLDEFGGAVSLLEKKLGDNRVITMKENKKLHDFLLRRGYSYGIIKEVFDSLGIKLEKDD